MSMSKSQEFHKRDSERTVTDSLTSSDYAQEEETTTSYPSSHGEMKSEAKSVNREQCCVKTVHSVKSIGFAAWTDFWTDFCPPVMCCSVRIYTNSRRVLGSSSDEVTGFFAIYLSFKPH
jgi:hypothetical protein